MNDPDDDWEDEDEDDIVVVRNEDEELTEYGCLFPSECCMPGEHLKCECHTVEMVQAFENEYAQVSRH